MTKVISFLKESVRLKIMNKKMVIWYCNKCGMMNDIKSKYCKHCLHRFEITGTSNVVDTAEISLELESEVNEQ